MPVEARWEHFEHGADIGVRGIGPDIASAFEQAALALTAVMVDPADVRAAEAVDIACEAPSDERLLVEWLNALIYETATRGLVFARFEVSVADGRLRGRAWGEPVDVARHQPAAEIKGATFTELHVGRAADGRWIAQCVVDV